MLRQLLPETIRPRQPHYHRGIRYLPVVLGFLLVTAGVHAESIQPHKLQPDLQQGILLVASKNLLDPMFAQSVILLTQHDHRGSSGIILNRRTAMPVASTFPEVERLLPKLEHLYLGGPVASSRISLLVRTETVIDGANRVLEDIYHIDTQALFRNLDFARLENATIRLFSGYAGWAPGQLQAEMQRGDWHTWRGNAETVFTGSPATLWQDLIALAGGKWVRHRTGSDIEDNATIH